MRLELGRLVGAKAAVQTLVHLGRQRVRRIQEPARQDGAAVTTQIDQTAKARLRVRPLGDAEGPADVDLPSARCGHAERERPRNVIDVAYAVDRLGDAEPGRQKVTVHHEQSVGVALVSIHEGRELIGTGGSAAGDDHDAALQTRERRDQPAAEKTRAAGDQTICGDVHDSNMGPRRHYQKLIGCIPGMSDYELLRALNLNLLPALDALLRERSVSAAARRMGVSQSAMSHSLAKLRGLLDDPLLVATGRGMVATPRGEELAAALPPALASLHQVLAGPAAFDPRATQREFRIATFDYFEITTLPDVLRYLRDHAPGITLSVERMDSRSVDRLVHGDIDLILGAEAMPMPAGLMQRMLYRDPFAVMVRADHPRVKSRMSLARYTELDHVLVSVEGRARGAVDRALAERKLSRRVSLRLPHFSTAALAVLHSDMACTIASTVAYRAKELYGVRVLPPPLELPRAGIIAWWPRQHQDDPARRWFRDVILGGAAVSPRIRKLMREHRRR